jgi:hypothetical protein
MCGQMRLLRGLGAIPVFLLATVLLVVAALLCVTVVLFPAGVVVGYVAMRMYARGVGMLLPRPKPARPKLARPKLARHRRHKVLHRRRRWSRRSGPTKRIRRVRKDARKRVRKARKALHV